MIDLDRVNPSRWTGGIVCRGDFNLCRLASFGWLLWVGFVGLESWWMVGLVGGWCRLRILYGRKYEVLRRSGLVKVA